MNILYTNTPGNYHRDKSEQPLYEHNAISHKISTMRKRFDTKKKTNNFVQIRSNIQREMTCDLVLNPNPNVHRQNQYFTKSS